MYLIQAKTLPATKRDVRIRKISDGDMGRANFNDGINMGFSDYS
jgi:hypothetical protein